MWRNLMVWDRQTREQGAIMKCLNDGWVRVLMDTGQIRDYRPKELTGLIRVSEAHGVRSGYRSSSEKTYV